MRPLRRDDRFDRSRGEGAHPDYRDSPRPRPDRPQRRAVLRATATLWVAGWLVQTVPGASAQNQPITVNRDVGNLVVLPAQSDATVTGTSTLDPNTDFLVRVFSQASPAFDREAATVVSDDGTWVATIDLTVAVDDQPITVECIYNGDAVASADGVIGPLSASVRFDDQRIGAEEPRVVITGARLEVGGFIVVTDGTDGSIRGVSDYLEGGTVHTDFAVPIDSPVDGAEQLAATAWLDVNGDRLFVVGTDSPYPAGNPASDSAVVRPVTPVPETTAPPTDTTGPPDSAGGLDVAVSLAGGVLGVAGLRRTTARLRDEAYRRRDGWNRPPVAQFVSVPERPRPGVPVLFDGSFSFDPDPDDAVERYEWAIGEAELRGPRRVHVFGSADEHDVELRVEDDSGAVGRHADTVRVETRSGRLELAAVNPADPRDESLTFHNAGDADLRVGAWSVHQAAETAGTLTPGSRTYAFPKPFTLPTEESVSIHTGATHSREDEPDPADHHLYWESAEPIWDDRSDALVVTDADGNPVFGARYERTDGEEYAIERVEPKALEDWFDSVSIDERLRIPLLGVTVGPRIGIGAIKNGLNFLASCLFLRGSAAFASAWGQITAFLALFLVTWLVSTGVGIVQPSIDVGGPILALLGAAAVTTVGGVAAATTRIVRWVVDRLP